MILVVDDNVSNQYVARVALQRFGFEAHVVENGEQAVRAYSIAPYELVLMDCRMPVLDGYEATEAIRSIERGTGKRTPIVAITACALSGDRERCLAAGMDDYVTKPVTLDGFRDILLRWLPECPVRTP